jgi:hypothetical protein
VTGKRVGRLPKARANCRKCGWSGEWYTGAIGMQLARNDYQEHQGVCPYAVHPQAVLKEELKRPLDKP